MKITKQLRILSLCLLAGTALSVASAGEATAAPSRPAKAAAAEAPSDGAYRAKVGNVELFLPAWFEAKGGKYDVVVHFHGISRAQESNVSAAKLNAAVVSVNLGVASDKYEAAFRDPRAFDALLATTHRLVSASKRAKGASMGRIALSAWSAGFASVSAILRQDALRPRIDAVLLADGLHASYSDPKHHVIEERSLGKYARLSEEAIRGEKLFVLTHSAIPTFGYANTTDTIGTVLRLAKVDKSTPPASAPRNMLPTYQVNRGDFHVTGFEGRGVSDHCDHIWAMGVTMFPLLAQRWSGVQKTVAEPS